MSESTNAGSNPGELHGSTDADAGTRPRRVGMGARGERALLVGGVVVLALFAIAWSWSIAQARTAESRGERLASATRTVAAAITGDAPAAAYVTDAAVEALAARSRGASGKLRVKPVLPEEVDRALGAISDFAQVTLTPFSAKQRGRIGSYLVGSWPGERGGRGPAKARTERYANPRGFIQVTQENGDTRVSE